MDLQIFESLRAVDWHAKATVAALAVFFSLFAGGWVRQIRRWWRLRPFPIINPGLSTKVQKDFIFHADRLINKGAEKVRTSHCISFNL